MKVEQPRLGRRGTLALLIMLDAFPPLTMDLYLPACRRWPKPSAPATPW